MLIVKGCSGELLVAAVGATPTMCTLLNCQSSAAIINEKELELVLPFAYKRGMQRELKERREKREKCIEWKRKRRERVVAHGSSPAAARAAREMGVE